MNLLGVIMGGTMYDLIMSKTDGFPYIREYLNGRLTQESFSGRVLQDSEKLNQAGLTDWAVKLLSRFPPDHHRPACRVLEALHAAGAIGHKSADEEGYAAYRNRILATFRHLPDRTTSIFPEETRVAYELSKAIGPGRIVVAGSYYLYFAVWLVPGLGDGGCMICLDVDKRVCRLARQNVAAMGIEDRVRVICGDAEGFLQRASDPIDLFVVDAYGSRDNSSPRHRGKAIYGPLVKAALPHMSPGSIILAHNAEEGAADLDEFYEALSGARLFIRAGTTENVGVYLL